MSKHEGAFRGLAAVLVLAATGCGHSGPVPVEGVVTLDNKPLERVTVTFVPADDVGQSASGLTGSDGSFRLTTTRFGDGARPGDYKIFITVNPPVPNVEAHEGMSPQEVIGMYLKARAEMNKKPQEPLAPVPDSYKKLETTPLRWRVPPDGQVILDLRKSGS
jgi:hypothetical protein